MSDVTHSEDPEPTPTCDVINEQLDAFMDRFNMLQKEALQYGITSVVLMCSHDHMDNMAMQTHAREGNWYAALGLLHATVIRMESQA